MPNNSYARGSKFEYFIADYYRSMGFTVLRAAGSHGPIDLCAIGSNSIMLIQCKTERKKTSYKQEMQALRDLPAPHNAVKVFIVKTKERGVIEIHNLTIGQSAKTTKKFFTSKGG